MKCSVNNLLRFTIIYTLLFCKITEQVAVSLEGRHGPGGEVVEPGSCEVARARVEQYFTQLRETLLLQEAAARSAVDTHVRERLCSLRQLQEDLSTWLSQVGHTLKAQYCRVPWSTNFTLKL